MHYSTTKGKRSSLKSSIPPKEADSGLFNLFDSYGYQQPNLGYDDWKDYNEEMRNRSKSSMDRSKTRCPDPFEGMNFHSNMSREQITYVIEQLLKRLYRFMFKAMYQDHPYQQQSLQPDQEKRSKRHEKRSKAGNEKDPKENVETKGVDYAEGDIVRRSSSHKSSAEKKETRTKKDKDHKESKTAFVQPEETQVPDCNIERAKGGNENLTSKSSKSRHGSKKRETCSCCVYCNCEYDRPNLDSQGERMVCNCCEYCWCETGRSDRHGIEERADIETPPEFDTPENDTLDEEDQLNRIGSDRKPGEYIPKNRSNMLEDDQEKPREKKRDKNKEKEHREDKYSDGPIAKEKSSDPKRERKHRRSKEDHQERDHHKRSSLARYEDKELPEDKYSDEPIGKEKSNESKRERKHRRSKEDHHDRDHRNKSSIGRYEKTKASEDYYADERDKGSKSSDPKRRRSHGRRSTDHVSHERKSQDEFMETKLSDGSCPEDCPISCPERNKRRDRKHGRSSKDKKRDGDYYPDEGDYQDERIDPYLETSPPDDDHHPDHSPSEDWHYRERSHTEKRSMEEYPRRDSKRSGRKENKRSQSKDRSSTDHEVFVKERSLETKPNPPTEFHVDERKDKDSKSKEQDISSATLSEVEIPTKRSGIERRAQGSETESSDFSERKRSVEKPRRDSPTISPTPRSSLPYSRGSPRKQDRDDDKDKRRDNLTIKDAIEEVLNKGCDCGYAVHIHPAMSTSYQDICKQYAGCAVEGCFPDFDGACKKICNEYLKGTRQWTYFHPSETECNAWTKNHLDVKDDDAEFY